MRVTRETLIDFIYDEVRMLDEGRYTEWLNLWLADGHYWMPLDYQQTDPINETLDSRGRLTSIMPTRTFVFKALFCFPIYI